MFHFSLSILFIAIDDDCNNFSTIIIITLNELEDNPLF